MRFLLKKVSGLDDAALSLKFSKRTWTEDIDTSVRTTFATVSNTMGFIKPVDEAIDPPYVCEAYAKAVDMMDKIAKYGAGVGISSDIDAGHETILRFIDFTVVVEDLHRGAMDDLDSHAMRMNNRIVRTSTRLGDNGSATFRLSDWYKDKIIPYFPRETDAQNAAVCMRNGEPYVDVGVGYVHGDLIAEDNLQDVIRGLYPLATPMSCIFKVSFHDMRHIYKRRNKYTHASPELKEGIEQLADQIERALPGTLGKLIRNDFCDDGELHHIMKISKHYKGLEG